MVRLLGYGVRERWAVLHLGGLQEDDKIDEGAHDRRIRVGQVTRHAGHEVVRLRAHRQRALDDCDVLLLAQVPVDDEQLGLQHDPPEYGRVAIARLHCLPVGMSTARARREHTAPNS